MAESDAVSVKYTSAMSRGETAMGGQRAVGSEAMNKNEAKPEVQEMESRDANDTAQNSALELFNSENINHKIIYTGQVDLETLDFDKSRTELCDYMSSIGAYQQSSSVSGGRIGYKGLKSAQYVFRVPKAKFKQSLNDISKFGTVVHEQSDGQDVTEQYFDTEARLKSLRIQQERLLELLKKAEKVEDILKIEKELQTTNYEIENLTGTLKKWDSLVEYSTLTVNLNEVEQITPVQPKHNDGLLYRISSGFKNSVLGLWNFIQDAIVVLVAAVPILLPPGAIGYLIYRLIRRKITKSNTVVDANAENISTNNDNNTES